MHFSLHNFIDNPSGTSGWSRNFIVERRSHPCFTGPPPPPTLEFQYILFTYDDSDVEEMIFWVTRMDKSQGANEHDLKTLGWRVIVL